VALGALLSAPAVADAYVIAGKRWPGRVITYHVGATHRAAVDAAARAWNRSGVRVRLRRAPRSRARVWIRHERRIGCGGLAQVGHYPGQRRATIVLGSCDGRRWPMTQIAIHEFGHLLGLGHERRRCATMNTSFTGGAPDRCEPPGPVLYRCRPLERDDLRGALRLYGGRLRRLGPATCPVFAPPGALKRLSAAADPDDPMTLIVRYRLPAAPRQVVDDWQRPHDQRLQLAAAPGACPATPAALLTGDRGTAWTPTRWNAEAETWLSLDAAGRHCVVARLVDSLGRSGPVATTTVQVAPPPVTVQIRGYPETIVGEELFVAADASEDVASVTWDFGDPAAGAANTATGQFSSHVYGRPGTYTVTVTVRSALGATATATRTVTVHPLPTDPEPSPGR